MGIWLERCAWLAEKTTLRIRTKYPRKWVIEILFFFSYLPRFLKASLTYHQLQLLFNQQSIKS